MVRPEEIALFGLRPKNQTALVREILSECRKAQADRPGHLQLDAGGPQLAALRVAGERDDVVAVAVGDEHEPSVGRDSEVAGMAAQRRRELDQRQTAVCRVDAVHGNAVVTPIGAVQEFAVRRQVDVRAGVASLVAVRQRGNCLDDAQPSGVRVERVDVNRAVQLVNAVAVRQLRMKDEVARSRSRGDACFAM